MSIGFNHHVLHIPVYVLRLVAIVVWAVVLVRLLLSRHRIAKDRAALEVAKTDPLIVALTSAGSIEDVVVTLHTGVAPSRLVGELVGVVWALRKVYGGKRLTLQIVDGNKPA